MAISAISLGLFGGSSSSSSSSITPLDLSSLYSAPQTFTPPKTPAKMAPWDAKAPKTPTDKLANEALSSSSLFTGGLGKGVGSGITSKNDRELFMLHNAVDKLRALAEIATNKSLSPADRQRFEARVKKGLEEIQTQAKANGLDGATLLAGRKFTSLTSGSFGNSTATSYETAALVDGDENTVPGQFADADIFNIKVTNTSGAQNIAIDLSEMGATPRTLSNVAGFINTKLAAANVETRFSRTESTKPATIKGGLPITQQKLKITYGNGETVAFEAGTGATQNVLYVAGLKTVDKIGQSVVSRIDLANPATPTTNYRKDFAATEGGANIRAMAKDADGSVYMIADVTGTLGSSTPKATSDVALQKLDSTGKVVWTRVLGSAAEAQGFSIAVDVDGTVAIAGAVNGKIDSAASISGDGRDSFVAAFDADGRDLWTHQQGAAGADEVKDIAFDANGNLMVLGKTTNSIGGAAALGGTDVYLQSLDADGAVRFTQSIGSASDDEPVGIKISGNDAYLAWNQNGAGHISRRDADNGNSLASDVLTNGLGVEKISDFDIDASQKIFVAGNISGNAINDRLVGFDFATQALTFSKDFAGTPVRALDIDGSSVNVAFEGTPAEGAANPLLNQTQVKGFNAGTGAEIYSTAVFGEATGQISILGTQGQSKALQALGLPQGELGLGDTSSLTDLTGLHAGDNFSISINGTSKRKISIVQGETMQTLVTKINRYVGTYANAALLSKDGAKYMTLTPKGAAKVEVFAGAGTQNALKEIGLDAGLAVANIAKTSKNYVPIVALELPTKFDLSDKTKAKTTMDALDGVLRRIRLGYREISTDPTMVALRQQTAQGGGKNAQNSGAIAAYNKQTLAGQDALARLGVY